MSKTIFKNGMPYIVEDDYEGGQTIEDVTPEDKASIEPEATEDKTENEATLPEDTEVAKSDNETSNDTDTEDTPASTE